MAVQQTRPRLTLQPKQVAVSDCAMIPASSYLEALKRCTLLLRSAKLWCICPLLHTHAVQDRYWVSSSRKYSTTLKIFTWKYLDFQRDMFDYAKHESKHICIEDNENNPPHQGKLGESAALDLWHLSHLTSCFSKSGWLRAIAHSNAFVPF
jgi:hypothetical protein